MAVEAVIDAETVWVCEVDPDASTILSHHWPHVPNLGDITEVDWSQVEPVDVLTLGFPCTDVSHAGRRLGLTSETRSGLWSHGALAIAALRPKLVVIENVRGLLSAKAERSPNAADVPPDALEESYAAAEAEAQAIQEAEGRAEGDRDLGSDDGDVGVDESEPVLLRAMGAVLGDLAELGYDARWCGVLASQAGAPHGRFRVFVIAWPRDPSDTAGAAGDERRRAASGPSQGRRSRPDTGGRGRAPAADGARDGRDEGRPEPARVKRRHDAAVGGDGSAADSGGEVGDGRPGLREGAEGSRPRGRRRRPGDDRPPPATADTGRDSRPEEHADVEVAAGRGRGSAPAADAEPVPPVEHRDDRGLARAPSGGAGPDGNPARAGTAGSGDQRGRGTPAVSGRRGTDALVTWGPYEPAIRRWERLTRPAPAPTEKGKRGQPRLAPRFVEWMMGLPAGHVTDVGISRNAQLKALGNGVVPQQAVLALRWLLFDEWAPLAAGVTVLPTPVATDAAGSGSTLGTVASQNRGRSLTDALVRDPAAEPKLMPTPSVADALGGHHSRSGDRSDELLLGGLVRTMTPSDVDSEATA